MQRVVDIVNSHAQRLGFPLIDINLQLWAIVKAVMANPGQPLIFRRQIEQRIAGCHERRVPVAGVVFKLHIKTGGAAQSADCRRVSGEDPRLVNAVKGFCRTFNDRKRGTGFRIAFIPVLQADKHTRDVLTVASRARAHGSENRSNVGLFMIKEIVLNFLHDF